MRVMKYTKLAIERKEELMERIKRYEETIDYDFWFIEYIKESVIELADESFWEKVMLKVSLN